MEKMVRIKIDLDSENKVSIFYRNKPGYGIGIVTSGKLSFKIICDVLTGTMKIGCLDIIF